MNKDLSEQIADLQSQFAYQEDSIQQLSDALYKQQQRMDDMEQLIKHLKNELDKAKDSLPVRSQEQEIPPHY